MHRSASQILVTVKSALIMWPACRVNDACPWIPAVDNRAQISTVGFSNNGW